MSQNSIFDLSNIPEVWGIASLDGIVKNERNAIKRGPFGSAIKKSFFVPTGYKVYEQKNVIHNNFKRGSYYISEEKFNELESFKLKAGDILMSCSGTVGRLAIVPSDFEEGIINQALLKITLNNNIIYTHFFFYLFGFNISRILQKNTRGSAMLNISSVRDLKNIQFPIPPLPEQHRIVAKIEELFTRLDAGVEVLKQGQAQLKRYRQAELKAAVEGRLTAEWRQQHKDELGPAEKLLEHIQEERKTKLGKKYKKPVPVDTSDLPELPDGWLWLRAEVICEKIQDGSHFSPKVQYSDKTDRKYLYVTAKNIRETGVNFSNITYVDEEFHRTIYNRCNVEKNDVLLIKDGVKTGIATVNQLDQEFSLLSSVALLKPYKKYLNPWYLKNYLNSPIGFKMVTGKMTGTAIKRIILQRIKETPIAVPPINEQAKIVEEVEKHISIIDGSETMIEFELKRARSLRQSILKRAFEGKLVPQDPEDPPASVLLEKIKEEKAKSKKSKQLEMF